MSDLDIKIKEEPHQYHDNFLDVTGNVFNSHEKGLPEWIKNSLGAYIREEINDRFIVIRFTDGDRGNRSSIESIDFVGMSSKDFDSFKEWGNPDASSRGINRFTFGGHGNGGKFYMRQMFYKSYFVTYRNSLLNVFGFHEGTGKYGFAEGLKDKKISLSEALKFANIDANLISRSIYKEMVDGKRGFTVVKGVQPKKLTNKLPVLKICQKLKFHPQARRPIKYSHIVIVHNGKIIFDPLSIEEIPPMEGFEEIYSYKMPKEYYSKILNKNILLKNDGQEGELRLRTSKDPMRGNNEDLNTVDIQTRRLGPVASYKMSLNPPLQYYPQALQIYGECDFPILEQYEKELVQNDRVFLNESNLTTGILEWIRECIDELGKRIFDSIAEAKKNEALEITDEFNSLLNSWKNQFLKKLLAEILGGPGEGKTTGGLGNEGSGGGKQKKSKKKDGLGSGGGKGGGDGDQKKPGLRTPIVLISERSKDPYSPDQEPPKFSDRHQIIEQRPEDVARGIYWINIRKPMASKIMTEYGAKSLKWRNYLFQRYVDIITTTALESKSIEEGGQLTKDQITQEYMRIASLIYDRAFTDLEKYIMDDKFIMVKDENSSNQQDN